ncbi:MAG: DNA polymerase III subunit delta' [Selenomonadaceae bacterium]|nr:DNA polymerase III subunit delta' [Selenomonadaceae bacterium]
MMETHKFKVVGFEKEFERLKRMVKREDMPHAALFTGPEGIGKRMVAMELSRMILCLKEGEEGCDCPSCKALMDMNHPDFYAVEPTAKGKSSPLIRIEEIGELLNNISRLPLLSKSRVCLIDGADFMNEAAANRLLKTLEEPTGDVKFFLIASRRSKILPTVLSRSMPVSFPALPVETIEKLLVERGIEEEAAKEAARLSFGSMKQAIALAEGDGLLIEKEVREFLQKPLGFERIWTLSKEMAEFDRERLQKWFAAVLLMLRDILFYYEGAAELASSRDMTSFLNIYDRKRALMLSMLTLEYEKRLTANVNFRLFMEGYLLKFRRIMEEK